MQWVEDLNRALAQIEENLTGEISADELAKTARCSSYHFQRMFAYLAGVTLGEYVRRRRMSLAAEDLSRGDKVIDVAMRYGYDSPTAFNRAFQSVHGIAPSQAQKEGAALRAFPSLHFALSIKGAEQMEYRIEKHDKIRIVGVGMALEKDIEKNFESVPQFWGKTAMEGKVIPQLMGLMNAQPMGILGISVQSAPEQWRYLIAVATDAPIPEGMEEAIIAPYTWAIFPGEGKNTSIQALERRIVSEWLPTSGYNYADGPDVEVYLNADPENAKYEVWIPVEKQG